MEVPDTVRARLETAEVVVAHPSTHRIVCRPQHKKTAAPRLKKKNVDTTAVIAVEVRTASSARTYRRSKSSRVTTTTTTTTKVSPPPRQRPETRAWLIARARLRRAFYSVGLLILAVHIVGVLPAPNSVRLTS